MANQKAKNGLHSLIYSALFLALAYVLPFLTGQIQQIGNMLCPMHIPVLLCGFICGWQWGLAVGAAAPLLRSLTLVMPPPFPTAVCMAFELAAYGAIAGLIETFAAQKAFVYIRFPSYYHDSRQTCMGTCNVHLPRCHRRLFRTQSFSQRCDHQRRSRHHRADSAHSPYRHAL